MTLTWAAGMPSTSATIPARTVRCPCPCGTEATCTVTVPTGSSVTVAVDWAPFFGPALARSAGVSTAVMYPILDTLGSTAAVNPMP